MTPLLFSSLRRLPALFGPALLGLLQLVGGAPALAQTPLSLDDLTKLSALPPGLPFEKMTAALLPAGWVYRGLASGLDDEVYWTLAQDSACWLSLRPMPTGTLDVIYKTSAARDVGPLRRELHRRKFPTTPVTCLACEGVRYEGPGYTVAVYSGKKPPYPYIVVLHQVVVPAPQLLRALPPPAAIR